MVRILHLSPHGCLSLSEENGNLHDHVIASVAVGLGIQDVILDAEDFDIVLFRQKIGNCVDIVYKGADNADSGHIV